MSYAMVYYITTSKVYILFFLYPVFPKQKPTFNPTQGVDINTWGRRWLFLNRHESFKTAASCQLPGGPQKMLRNLQPHERKDICILLYEKEMEGKKLSGVLSLQMNSTNIQDYGSLPKKWLLMLSTNNIVSIPGDLSKNPCKFFIKTEHMQMKTCWITCV